MTFSLAEISGTFALVAFAGFFVAFTGAVLGAGFEVLAAGAVACPCANVCVSAGFQTASMASMATAHQPLVRIG